MWNPTLFAVYNNRLDVVKYLVNESSLHINKNLCLTLNQFKSEKSCLPDNDIASERCLSLLISIANKNVDML